jgi:ribosomal protein L37AE/L43A
MPKVDFRRLNIENNCPHCGGDEVEFNEDGLLECIWCGKSPTDDVDGEPTTQKKVIKKMKNYE